MHDCTNSPSASAANLKMHLQKSMNIQIMGFVDEEIEALITCMEELKKEFPPNL